MTRRRGVLKSSYGRFALVAILLSLACAVQVAPQQPSAAQPQTPDQKSALVVLAGTKVALALTSPIMARTAMAGESVYAQTAFPVAVDNHMAIPAGTYVLGQIDSMTKPGFFSPHAQFQMHFTKIMFADGYTVLLPQTPEMTNGQAQAPVITGAAAPGDDVIAAVATPFVQVSSANDVLLDNGAQIDMVLQLSLRLDADKVEAAVRRSKPTPLPQFKPATMCRPSAGTSDTVIPGTPGTPSTTIPGGPGMPDITIPGTPGTPDTIIPGTPGVSCPSPPVVMPAKIQNYEQSFQIGAPAQVAGKPLAAGSYHVSWEGPGPQVQAAISQNQQTVMNVPARWVLLKAKSAAGGQETTPNPDGSVSLRSLRFAGQNYALYFDQGGE